MNQKLRFLVFSLLIVAFSSGALASNQGFYQIDKLKKFSSFVSSKNSPEYRKEIVANFIVRDLKTGKKFGLILGGRQWKDRGVLKTKTGCVVYKIRGQKTIISGSHIQNKFNVFFKTILDLARKITSSRKPGGLLIHNGIFETMEPKVYKEVKGLTGVLVRELTGFKRWQWSLLPLHVRMAHFMVLQAWKDQNRAVRYSVSGAGTNRKIRIWWKLPGTSRFIRLGIKGAFNTRVMKAFLDYLTVPEVQ